MAVAPFDYRPPIDSAKEFVGPPTDPEDERIEVGVAIVGGGPAGLACAIRLTQLLETEPSLAESLGEVPVALIEKGRNAGSHLMSGAVMRPSAIRELLPDVDPKDWPFSYGEVPKDTVYFMTKRRKIALKPTPPPFRNHGNYVISIAQLGRYLAEKAEEAGVYVLTETTAQKLLVEDGVVRGVRTGDKGRGREGEELSNFEPGSDVVARATVLAEGTQGHLAGAAIRHFGLAEGADPPQWELGVKEIWEVQKPLDRVIHTMGWPLRFSARYREFGGSWIYPMGEDKISMGFVVGLDYKDATFSVHDVLQEFKTHPFVRGLLEGGKRVGWGAKTIPSGGYWAMPEKLWAPGMVVCGDSASMVNVPRLKGVHYAMHAGIYAAEAIFAQLKRGEGMQPVTDLSEYEQKVRNSDIERDLYETRNMRQVFSKGFFIGGALVQPMVLSKGKLPPAHFSTHDDAQVPVFIGDRNKRYPKPDGKLTFDKLSSVFATGNATRDDAPNHIRIRQQVPLELALTWQYMCPAQVYQVPEETLEKIEQDGGLKNAAGTMVDLEVTPSNCVQCGAITAKGGRLTPPEGGDGPNYQQT